jgi:hypothetical membrane protein
MPGLGPMVHRSAKVGAVLLMVGVVEFLVGMAVAQSLFHGGYSLTNNYISDLGNSDLGAPGAAHALVFNVSIVLLGILGLSAAVLLRPAFPSRSSVRVGLAALFLASLFALTVGVFPENYHGGTIHTIVSALTFFFSGLALVFLALGMIRDTRWGGYRAYTLVSGLVTWGAMALFIAGPSTPLGVGGMERLIVAPILLWGLVAGVHILRIPTYRPTPVPGWGPESGST